MLKSKPYRQAAGLVLQLSFLWFQKYMLVLSFVVAAVFYGSKSTCWFCPLLLRQLSESEVLLERLHTTAEEEFGMQHRISMTLASHLSTLMEKVMALADAERCGSLGGRAGGPGFVGEMSLISVSKQNRLCRCEYVYGGVSM